MKKLVCATAIMIAASSMAYAGGQTVEPVASDNSYHWTGFYAGGDAGYMWGHANLYDVNGRR